MTALPDATLLVEGLASLSQMGVGSAMRDRFKAHDADIDIPSRTETARPADFDE